jgi:hypothetical protein
MSWKNILKTNIEEGEELISVFRNAFKDKRQDDFEYMAHFPTHFNMAIGPANIFVAFEDIREEEDEEIEESEIFNMDEGYYRITLDSESGHEIILADYTLDNDFRIVESDYSLLHVDEINELIKQIKEYV